MKVFVDHIGILEIFVEAQQLVVQRPWPDEGYVLPQKGKSGLTRANFATPEERLAARAAVVRESRRRAIAKDPTYRAREQAKSNERNRRFRARKKEQSK